MFGLLKDLFSIDKAHKEGLKIVGKKSDAGFHTRPKKTKSVQFEEIENISLKYQKHPLSRRIKMTLKGHNSVLVTIPKYSSFKDAKIFARQNLNWLKKSFEKYEAKEKPTKKEIEQLRKKAKEILPKKLEELAQKHGFKYGNLRIKNAKSRWGSCSWNNNINLNLNLVLLDDELIEYVILHELTHTVIKNHSAKFWQLLCKHLPNALELRRKLKKTKL